MTAETLRVRLDPRGCRSGRCASTPSVRRGSVATSNSSGRGQRIAAVIGLALALSGCASGSSLFDSPFYSEADDKAAKAAKETSDAIDYLKPVTEERANQARLLEYELAVVGEYAVARRNLELLILLSKKTDLSGDLLMASKARIERLVGANTPTFVNLTIADLRKSGSGSGDSGRCLDLPNLDYESLSVVNYVKNLIADNENCEERLRVAQEDFWIRLRFDAPPCPANGHIAPLDNKSIKGQVTKYRKTHPTTTWTDDQISAEVQRVYKRYSEVCTGVRADQAALQKLIVGCSGAACFKGAPANAQVSGLRGKSEPLLVEAYNKLNETRTELLDARTAAEAAQSQFKSAVKAYEEAAKANLQRPGTDTQNKVDKAAEGIKKALENLTKVGDKIGLEIAAAEQIDRINLLLEAAGSGEVDKDAIEKNSDLAGALGVANALPGFIDNAKFIKGLVAAPPISSLLLEKAKLQAIAADAKRAVERQEKLLSLRAQKIEALAQEADLMSSTEDYVGAAEAGGASISLDDLVEQKIDQERRENLTRGIEEYLSVFTGPQRELNELAYREIALQREQGLDRTETSLRIWQASIQVPVDALAAYYETGLKPEDVVQFLQAIGLGAIAAGVN